MSESDCRISDISTTTGQNCRPPGVTIIGIIVRTEKPTPASITTLTAINAMNIVASIE